MQFRSNIIALVLKSAADKSNEKEQSSQRFQSFVPPSQQVREPPNI